MQKEITKYLANKETNRPRASIAYRKPLMLFIEACGDRNIEDYGIDDITAYTKWMQNKYANETVRYSLIVLKNIFSFYTELGRHCLSPKLIIIPRKKQANSYRAIQPKEVQQILSSIVLSTFADLRDFVMQCVLWETGVRVSELCNLNIEDIDLENVRGHVGTRKTSWNRIIKWSDKTNIYLKLYLREYLKLVPEAPEAAPVFINLSPHNQFSRITTRSVQRIIKQRAIDAGIEAPTTPHGNRHGWARIRRRLGAQLSFIQSGLGHRSPYSSHTYLQYENPEFEREASTYLISDADREKVKIEELQYLTQDLGRVIPEPVIAHRI